MFRFHASPSPAPCAAGSPERRRFRRMPLGRPVKLRCETTGQYFTAEGIDASAGGALLRLRNAAHLPIGQPVRIGIGSRERRGLLLADDMIDARVIRCLGHADARYVALQFDVPVFLAEAG